ncbi:hypothetical protein EVAR_91889_1 [Eumeta japonica]|uniref:Uncharacterized protein n=1 Tax=Eumeta variegata TaxID=151549 RepID=A0A4C1TKH1_EUMVA|nr:hypothetical protein EVAR_91889_1 [Eumeta japonica]
MGRVRAQTVTSGPAARVPNPIVRIQKSLIEDTDRSEQTYNCISSNEYFYGRAAQSTARQRPPASLPRSDRPPARAGGGAQRAGAGKNARKRKRGKGNKFPRHVTGSFPGVVTRRRPRHTACPALPVQRTLEKQPETLTYSLSVYGDTRSYQRA